MYSASDKVMGVVVTAGKIAERYCEVTFFSGFGNLLGTTVEKNFRSEFPLLLVILPLLFLDVAVRLFDRLVLGVRSLIRGNFRYKPVPLA